MSLFDKLLIHVRDIINDNTLTVGELHGVLDYLTKNNFLGYNVYKPKHMTNYYYDKVIQYLLDGDGFGEGVSTVKAYLQNVRKKALQKEDEKKVAIELAKIVDYNPEEDMTYMSNKLLRDDDVYYIGTANEEYHKELLHRLHECMTKNINKLLKEIIQ